MVKKAMLIGVGVGKNVENAIYTSIKYNNPNFIAFVTTDQSKNTLLRKTINVEDINDFSSLEEIADDYEIYKLENQEDLNTTFRDCERILDSIKRRGYKSSEIVVDITSGTKIMSATIAALAITYQLYALMYVSGKRDDCGVVIKGTERPEIIKPFRILFGNNIERIKEYFRLYQFDAAIKIANRLLDESWFLNENEKQTILEINEILYGFVEWDRFNHKKAIAHFEKVTLIETEKQKNFLVSLKTEQNRIMANLSKRYKINKEITGIPSLYLIVDIFQNAKRRYYQGKFDDAIARLYRCLEMVGQHLLFMENEILSSNVDLDKVKDKVPIEYYNKLEGKKNNNEKQKRIETGLVDDFELLSYLNRTHPVSVQYLTNKGEFKKCILYRNQSILAHGTSPLTKEKYESLENITNLILKSLIPQVDSMNKEIESYFEFIFPNAYFL